MRVCGREWCGVSKVRNRSTSHLVLTHNYSSIALISLYYTGKADGSLPQAPLLLGHSPVPVLKSSVQSRLSLSLRTIYGKRGARSDAQNPATRAVPRASESTERACVQKWQDMPSQPPLEVVEPAQWHEVHTTNCCVRVRARAHIYI